MQPARLKYLASWTRELRSKADRVRQLIGDKHWLSDGHHKEYLIRDFLRRHLPTGYLVARGFIAPPSSDDVSREIDILVTNPAAAAPWFAESDMLVSPPDSVIAHIHVKTKFAKNELIDALTTAASVQALCAESEQSDKIWSAVCFFTRDGDATVQSIFSDVCDVVSDLKPSHHSVDYIVLLDGPLIVLSSNEEASSRRVSVRAFDCGEHSFALSFADLFSRLATIHSGRASDWFQMIHRISTTVPLAKEITS